MHDKETILKSALSFMESKLVLTSVELGLYDTLNNRKISALGISEILGLDTLKAVDFLDALLSLGFIRRENDGLDALYFNTEASAKYLVSSSENYIGGMLIMSSKRLYKYWHDLPEALRTGKAQSEVKNNGKHLFETMYEDPEKLYDFCKAMQSLSRDNFRKFVELYDFEDTKTHLDIGGSLGVLCDEILKKNPELDCSSLDLPNVTKLAVKERLNEKTNYIPGDMFKSELQSYDSISLGLILHDWNLEDKKKILKRCYESLNEGGRLIVIENIIDDERRETPLDF